jgi:superfamily II DNA helicase RecQ
MGVHIFTIPFDPKKEVFQDDELRKFLVNKQVTRLEPQFFQHRDRAYWSVFVEYEAVLGDPRSRDLEALNAPQQLLYQRLREWRSEQAEQDGIPVFIIANNTELRQLALRAPRTLDALRQIRGFGKKKVARYGQPIVGLITAFYDMPSGETTNDPETRKTK